MSQDLHNPHDSLFKAVWSRPEVARSFVRHYLPSEVVGTLRLDTLELVRDAFVDEQLKAHYSELLYRILGQDGRPAHVYVLLEHKSSPERDTAFQLLRYTLRIWESAKRQSPGSFPPRIIPILVYHGERPWPYGQDLHDAYDLPPAFAPYTPNLHYELCDLSKLAEERIKGAVLLQVAMRLMKHIRDGDLGAELPGIFAVLRKLRQQRTAVEYLDVLLRYLAGTTDLNRQEVSAAIIHALPESGERLMFGVAAKWFPEVLEQGRQEGLQEGLQQGHSKGLVQGQALFLIRLLEHRFGPITANYRKRIETADPDTLLTWAERVSVVDRIEAVFEP